MKNFRDQLFALGGSFSISAFATVAHADMVADVGTAVAKFDDLQAVIPVVGGAFLIALAAMTVWKLARGIFG